MEQDLDLAQKDLFQLECLQHIWQRGSSVLENISGFQWFI